MKISIIGYSGSGKSTLAAALAKKHGHKALHLDSVHYLEGWVARSREEEIKIVSDFLSENEGWVIDGTYTKVCYDKRLDSSDEIILLLLGRFTCFMRAFRRYLKFKGQRRPDMAEGCPEKFDKEFISWLLFHGRTRKRRELMNSIIEKYGEKVTVIRSQRQLDKLYCQRGLENPSDI